MNRTRHSTGFRLSDRNSKFGYHSCCEQKDGATLEKLPLKNELLELCREIAGALLRGHADGRSGRAVRQVIVKGLITKLKCSIDQAQCLVDLSLELINLEAYGSFRRNTLEMSLLVARGGGEVGDLSQN